MSALGQKADICVAKCHVRGHVRCIEVKGFYVGRKGCDLSSCQWLLRRGQKRTRYGVAEAATALLQSEPAELNGHKVYILKGKSEDLDGVTMFNPQGKPIGFIRLPERCANLTFGGPKNNRLYMTASHSLYALYVEAHGAT
jgi:SMP-30/Gluconolactonase/LRE-like region